MKTVASISGGKTSSYMAEHFPADYLIFSLVHNENHDGKIKDLSLERYAKEKVGEFISTPETDQTIKVMRDLEQRLGRKIVWVKSEKTFDQLVRQKKYMPNRVSGFCSMELKTIPVFRWCYNNLFVSDDDMVEMMIGYRADEHWRQANPQIKVPISQSLKGSKRRKHKTFNWRQLSYPLIENLVFKKDILKWAYSTGLDFPPDDNCQHCFWKNPILLYKNMERDKAKIKWAADIEDEIGGRWRADVKYSSLLKRRPQLELFDIEEISPMCDTGFCTA